MLDKITLVVPTHDRHHYLTRILDYYSDIEIKILVADSSEYAYPQRDAFRVDYFHYPNYSPLKKLADIIQKVYTPYVFICADDDFIVQSALQECIEFLEKNADYASVQGHYICFKRKGNHVSFYPAYLHSIGYDINANTPEDRMKQSMSLYMHLIYSIHKRENLQDSFSLLEIHLSNFNLIELLVSIISVIHGKHKVLPVFYSARESIEILRGRERDSLKGIMENPDMKEEYDLFIELISDHLATNYGYSKEDSRKYVLEAINCYINIFLPYRRRLKEDNLILNKNALLRVLRSLIPYSILKVMQEMKSRKDLIKQTRGIKGFPFYDKEPEKELDRIKFYINKYTDIIDLGN